MLIATWDSVWWQFASSQHDVSEIKRAVVDVTGLQGGAAGVRAVGGGGDPAQGGQVTSS